MTLGVTICKALNRLFPLPVHPFNLQNEGVKTYAQWQYEKGRDTIKFYLERFSADEMFRDKIVLDIGCGAAGKTLYYATCGAQHVYGIDIVPEYKDESLELARQKNLVDRFTFLLGDAAALPFTEEAIDTIIMSDAAEHVDKPGLVLAECFRVLKAGGRLYLNFPPYYHPFGAHLSDAIGIPWAHLIFGEQTLIEAYKDLVGGLPDGPRRIDFRIARDDSGKEYFSYVNKMTIRRFTELLKRSPFRIIYRREVPLRDFLRPLAGLPLLKEGLTRMVVTVLRK